MKTKKDNQTGQSAAPSAEAAGSAARYWHEVPPAEREQLIKESKMTVGKLLERFKQPDWCEYPEALAGQMGCWSLVTSRNVNGIKDCGDCEYIKAKPQNTKRSGGAAGKD